MSMDGVGVAGGERPTSERVRHAGVQATLVRRSSKAWLALLAALLVGVLASGAQAQLDEGSSGATTSSQESSVLNSYIVTFSAETSDSAARELLSSVDATVRSHIAPLRMYSVVLPSATASSAVATLEADAAVSRV